MPRSEILMMLLVLLKVELGEDAQYWLSSKKLFNDTGWKPEISIDEGIKETVDWVKE